MAKGKIKTGSRRGARQVRVVKTQDIEESDESPSVRIEAPSAKSLIQTRLEAFAELYEESFPVVPSPVTEAMNAIIDTKSTLGNLEDVRVALLGRAGVGKTTLLNMLLLMTENPRSDYIVDEEQLEALKKKAQGSLELAGLLPALESQTPKSLLVVEPAPAFSAAFDPVGDSKMREALQHFRSMSDMRGFAKNNGSKDENLTHDRFLETFARSFLLPQAEGADVPTTQYIFEICLGDVYRIEVEYEARADVVANFVNLESDMEESDDEENSVDSTEQGFRQSARELAEKVLESRPTGPSSSKRARPTRSEEEDGDSFSFKPEVARVLGRTIVFLAKGEDIVEDRTYCAGIIRTLGRHGVSGVCEWAKDPLAFSTANKKARIEETDLPADGWVVKLVRVFVPSILLQQGLCLLDIPGVDDVSTLRWNATKTALETCDAVVALTDKDGLTANKTILEPLQSFIMPRMFGKGSKPALALFKCVERSKYRGEDDGAEQLKLPTSTANELFATLPKAHKETDFIKKDEVERVKAELGAVLQNYWTSLRPVLSASLVLDSHHVKDLQTRRKALESTGMSKLFDFLLDTVVRTIRDPLRKTVEVAGEKLALFRANPSLLEKDAKGMAKAIAESDSQLDKLYKEHLDRFYDLPSKMKAVESAVSDDIDQLKKYLAYTAKVKLKRDLESGKGRQLRTIVAVFTAKESELKASPHRTCQALDWFTNLDSAHFSGGIKPLELLDKVIAVAVNHVVDCFEELPLFDDGSTEAGHWSRFLKSPETKRALSEAIRKRIQMNLDASAPRFSRALNENLRSKLRDVFRQVFGPVVANLPKNCKPAQAREAVYNAAPSYTNQVPKIIVSMIVDLVKGGLEMALPNGKSDIKNSGSVIAKTIRKFWTQAKDMKVHGVKKVLKNCLETVDDLARLDTEVLHSKDSGKRFESHVLFDNLTRELTFEFRQRPVVTANISALQHEFDARTERFSATGLHALVSKVHRDEVKHSFFESLAQVILVDNPTQKEKDEFLKTLDCLKCVVFCQYIHNPDRFKLEFGLSLGDFLHEVGYYEHSRQDPKSKASAFLPRLHVPLLQALCDLFDRAVRVTVKGKAAPDIAEYLLMPRLPATIQNNCILVDHIVLHLDMGFWSRFK